MKKKIVLQVLPTVLGLVLLSHVGIASATPANTFADYHFEVDFESFDHEDPRLVEIFDNAFSPEVGFEFGPLTVLDPEQGVLVFNHCGLGGECWWSLVQNGTVFDENYLPPLPDSSTRFVYLGYESGIGFHPNARFWLNKPYAAVGVVASCAVGTIWSGINTLEVFDSVGNLLEVQERTCAHVQDFAARSELAIIGTARPEGIREFTIEGDFWVAAAVLLRELRVCGDGIVDSTEECDDGNLEDGDGCSSVCTIETGWTCTQAASDAASSCEDGCLNAGKAVVKLKQNGGKKDKLVVKLTGAGIIGDALGDPETTAFTHLRLFDENGWQLEKTLSPNTVLWDPVNGSGYKFLDKSLQSGHGIKKVLLKPESKPGKSNGKATFVGQGEDLDLPPLNAMTGTLRAELSNSEGLCVRAVVSEATMKPLKNGFALNARTP